MILDGQKYTIQLHDTAGQEEYDKIRQQFYKRVSWFGAFYKIAGRNQQQNWPTLGSAFECEKDGLDSVFRFGMIGDISNQSEQCAPWQLFGGVIFVFLKSY